MEVFNSTNEFLVSAGNQGSEITALKNGSFLLTWSGLNGGFYDVIGRIYSANGAATGNSFIINSYTEGNQLNQKVASLSSGNFIVTWISVNQDEIPSGPYYYSYSVYAQLYDPLGRKIGSEFRINNNHSGDQSAQNIATLSNGNFIVTWLSTADELPDPWPGYDPGLCNVYARLFDVNGNPIGNEFRVNSTTAGAQFEATPIALNDGKVLILWNSNQGNIYNVQYDIFGQIYDQTGSPLGAEFRINTYVNGSQNAYKVCTLSNGNFVIAWQSWDYGTGQDGSQSGVFAQIYDSFGNPIGTEFQVNTYWYETQAGPFISALGNGGFIIGWNSRGQDGANPNEITNSGVYAQMYDQYGNRIGGEFLVNSYTLNHQFGFKTLALSDKGFLITWNSIGQDGDWGGIYAQLYDIDGNKVGGEFRINNTTAGSQGLADAEMLSDGTIIFSWTTQTQVNASFSYSSFAKLYTPTKVNSTNGVVTLSTTADAWIGSSVADKITGLAGDDDLHGIGGNDLLNGGDGNDSLYGGLGIDTLVGGRGNDTYFVNITASGNYEDIITENTNEGSDTIKLQGTFTNSSNISLLLPANVENLDISATNLSKLNVTGNNLANVLVGNGTVNVITGGALGDTMDGTGGSDIYIIASVADYAGDLICDTGIGAGDIDEIRFTATASATLMLSANTTGVELITIGTGTGSAASTTGTTAININASALSSAVTVVGNSGANSLTGTAYADTLIGNAGNDLLIGGGGSDRLIGGLGKDTMTGGAGADTFVFDTAPNASTNVDTITDFNVIDDTIALENAIFTALGLVTGSLSFGAFQAGAAAQEADDRIIYNPINGALIYDANGSANGGAVQIAILQVGLAITNADFLII